jgi:hypothetical protein
MRRFHALVVPLVAALAMLVVGCGSGGTILSGKVVSNGQPYSVENREAFGLSFQQIDGNRQTYWATVSKEGQFHLAKPLPAGKYRICATHRADYTAFMQQHPGWGLGVTGGPPDKLGGQFNGERSPLTIDLSGKESRLTIDLGQRTVTIG